MKTILSSVAVLLLAAFAAHTLWLWWNGQLYTPLEQTAETTPTYEVVTSDTVTDGYLYLTLEVEVGDPQYPTLYQLSNDPGLQLRWTGLRAVTETAAPDLTHTAFVAYPSVSFQEEHSLAPDVMQIMIADENGIITPLTKSDTHRKLMPEWSPDSSLIAFMASTSANSVPAGSAEFWDVFVVDLNGVERYVTTGAYPQWSQDGTALFVLQEEGVVRVDVTTGVETMMYTHTRPLTWYDKLIVNHVGDQLALVLPSEGGIILFQHHATGNGPLKVDRHIFTTATSATFSPDDTHFAVVHPPTFNEFPSLSIINIANVQTVETIPLDGFAETPAIVTDWILSPKE